MLQDLAPVPELEGAAFDQVGQLVGNLVQLARVSKLHEEEDELGEGADVTLHRDLLLSAELFELGGRAVHLIVAGSLFLRFGLCGRRPHGWLLVLGLEKPPELMVLGSIEAHFEVCGLGIDEDSPGIQIAVDELI